MIYAIKSITFRVIVIARVKLLLSSFSKTDCERGGPPDDQFHLTHRSHVFDGIHDHEEEKIKT